MKKKLSMAMTKAMAIIFIMGTTAVADVDITDTRGREIHFDAPPVRAVSIVPSTTEVICNLGAADALAGVTYHSALPRQKNDKPIVGGFSSPDIQKIADLNPDVVFISSFQQKIIDQLDAMKLKTVCLDITSYDQGMKNIEILANIFNKPQKGKELLNDIEDDIAVIAAKLNKLNPNERKRVVRLMGRDKIMTPTANAFLNQLVIRAGGIPMAPKGDGMVTEISLEQWQKFNPQFIFGCGDDKKAAEKYFNQDGWKDVDAVKNHNIHYFPCELTCRISSYTGYFIQWLASSIYNEEFFQPDNQVFPDEILITEPIPIPLKPVKKSQRITSRLADFKQKTLVIDLNTPQTVLSTLEGFKTGITTVVNHYLPPPAWNMAHTTDMAKVTKRILTTVKRDPATSALLMTGANMDHLTVTRKNHKALSVTAVVTAGVCSNAQRASRSTGFYYDPGTINIIVMTNRKLSPRAMSRAIICATEGKSAAMADLDIRSSDDPLNLQATGTGTDNIIVVQGEGAPIDGAGGHTKLGELIAGAVYDGVKKAVFLQNGITDHRNVFQRLEERHISLHTLAKSSDCQCSKTKDSTMASELERLLLMPQYAGVVEQAFALCDAMERGQIKNLSAFSSLAVNLARKISKAPVDVLTDFASTRSLPEPLKLTFNALMTGITTLHDLSPDLDEKEIKSKDQAMITNDISSADTGAAMENSSTEPMPRRIISLGPVLTKTIYLLGAGDRLLADTTYCDDPPNMAPKEKIGSLIQVNVEKIISLKPDLVLASQFTKEKQIRVLEQFDIKVVPFKNPKTFEEICANTRRLGKLINVSDKAEQIIKKARAEVTKVQNTIAALPPKKVFIQIGIKPLHTANEETFVHEFIRLSGGINIAAHENSGVYSREKVVKQNPDIILISTMGSSKSAGITEKQQWMKFDTMAAVQHNAIHLLDSEIICSPTPLIFVKGVKEIARLLHPSLDFKG
ncbi:ABC-type Fe3+-hydroxamate transport system, substrate-binding protein [Desulfocicer vacuolatum DSM 3385]|uniref:ABC-type Fe3+-hydroxamate transport system, substrate-binding protein n=1 Tax=Desulfocicer vacuolatum DSM 3385 TaxID=1121400 RepID=A0A1W2DSV1_9BACT|nr:helical backbone metal receptor [Desulfocicer vacuolatum]SMD00530.1 ABC-type Fe3+-hydroxamate transport system, substrate-binding protein [Desulfocicer vacuolatum DSM 3385]